MSSSSHHFFDEEVKPPLLVFLSDLYATISVTDISLSWPIPVITGSGELRYVESNIVIVEPAKVSLRTPPL